MNCHSTSSLLSFKLLLYDDQERHYEVIKEDKQYNYYITYLLKPLKGIFRLRVGCHVWSNTTEYTVDYRQQNGTDFRFIG